MRKVENEEKTTTNSRVYRLKAIYTQLYCPICGLNRGCNRADRWGHKYNGGWKSKKIKKQWERHMI